MLNYRHAVQTHSQRTVRSLHGEMNWDGPASTGSSTAAAPHTTRSSASTAPAIAVRPPRAQTGNPARAVAGRAPWRWTGHRDLVHYRFNEDGAHHHAYPELRKNDWTHKFGRESSTRRERICDILRENQNDRGMVGFIG